MVKISVIIPTLNGARYIGELLRGLERQSVRAMEVLVIDSSSIDDTVSICEAHGADVQRIPAESFDHGGSRKIAASRAKGDVLVFMTQDALTKDSKTLENLVRPLLADEAAASYARQIAREGATPIEKFLRAFNYPAEGVVKGLEDLERLGVKTFFFSNVCSAIKKEAFNDVGGFPEKTITNEDMFLAARLIERGYKIAYEPEAVVYHSHNNTLGALFRRYFDIGVFFNRNKWITDMAVPGGEGLKFIKEELRCLLKDGYLRWIPYAILDAVTRFMGYRVGLLEGLISLWMKKKLSASKNFWSE